MTKDLSETIAEFIGNLIIIVVGLIFLVAGLLAVVGLSKTGGIS